MTIFLITELYPADENDHSITHAVKHFADSWTEEVIVFIPLSIGLSTIGMWKRYMGMFNDVNRQISGKKVVFFPLLKVPFLRKYFFWIKHRNSLPSPQVIAGHCLKGNHMAFALSKRYGIPFSAGMHNHDIIRLKDENKQYSKVLSAASLIACRSHSIQRKLNALTANRFDQKTFIANSGIEEGQIEEEAVFTRKALELGKKELRIITPARLNAGKNININIDVLSELKQPFRYTIIGEGPDRDSLLNQIDRLKLSNRIEILGWKKRSEVLDYLSHSDLFIMVSAPETFGLAYLEAMAKGCMVIGAIGHGVDGIIQHQKNGFLVEPGDRGDLKKVLEEILKLPAEKRKEIAGMARKTILELTEEKVSDAYLANLKKLHTHDTRCVLMMERGLNQNEIQYLLDHLAYLYKGPNLHEFLVYRDSDLKKSETGVLHIPLSNNPLSEEKIFSIDNIPVLFPCSTVAEWFSIEKKSIRFHHDLLKSAFYLLSGYQEYMSEEKDRYGRYPGNSSIQYKLGISGKPLVNYYFDVILTAFEKLCMMNNLPFERTEREKPVLFLSHDIDRIKKYSFRNLAYVFLQLIKIKPDNDSIGLAGLFRNMLEILPGVLFRLKDPYWNFAELKETEKKLGISSTWFFLEKRKNMNSRYHFHYKKIRKLIEVLSATGDEIGIHGTLESSEKADILAGELQRLESMSKSPVYGIRQHFLKYLNPTTTKIQSDTSLLYDATLGFAEQIGFRNSYAYPFKLYDFKRERSMEIWQIPLNVMDITLLGYMNTPLPKISETIRPIIEEVSRFKGVFSLLWHQCRLDEKDYPGINASYESLLDEIMALGFDSLCGEEIISAQEH